MGGKRGRDHPKSVQQRRTIPQSRPLAVTAPFTQGSLGDGGCGLPRRPVGPPRNDNGFLSFRGQCAHWTWESVLFTMDGDPGRRGRRPLRKGGIAAATTQASGAQRSVCAADARDGRESAQRPSQKGDRPATAGAALSEAESAERAAGQIRFLPDDLRVQHGAEGSEVSAKPRPCPRRGCITE